MIVAAAALALILRQLDQPEVVYDAAVYFEISRLILAGQTSGWEFRTYGYPAFLAPLTLLAGNDPGLALWMVFPVQLAIHLAAAWLLARRVARAFGDGRLGRLTLILVALNPILLARAGRMGTDLLSTALIALAAALLLPPRADRPAPGTTCRDGILALFTLALAAEVRPANAILLPIGMLIWIIRWWPVARQNARRLVGGVLLVGGAAALPLLPQMLLNWHEYGRPHPLTVRALYADQVGWGLQYLKYATIRPSGYTVPPGLFYKNPFHTGETSLAELARANPLGSLATLALHGFNLFDQSSPSATAPEVETWYRWPLSVLAYLFVIGAAIGLVLGWRRSGVRRACAALSFMALAYLGLYLPTAVETRFGMPLFVLLAPFVGMTLLAVHGRAQARAWGHLAGIVLGTLLVVGACTWLSIWMQAQAHTLVVLREFFRAPGPETPVARFDVAPPERWTVEQQQTYVVRATNLGERTWFRTHPAQVFLHIMFVGPGDAETVDSRVELRLLIDREVPPGGQLEMEARITAPRKEGSYRLRHQVELDKELGLSGGSFHDTPVTVEVRRSRGGSPRG